MRSMFRGALVALVAALALTAVASASASTALPTFTVPAGMGETESYPLKAEFASSTVGSTISNTTERWSCTGASGALEVKQRTEAGESAMPFTIELKGCGGGLEKCETEGAEVGDELLSGTASPVALNESKTEAGLLLALTPTRMYCFGGWDKLRGSILVPVTPLNTPAKALTLPFEGNGEGEAKYHTYYNVHNEEIEAKLELNFGSGYKQAALEMGETLNWNVAEGKSLEVEAAGKAVGSDPPEFALGEGGAFPVALEGSSAAAMKISNEVEALKCKGVKSGDSVTGAKAVSVDMEFSNCATAFGTKCETAGAGAGIAILTGSAGVVYIDKAERLAGSVITLNAGTIVCGSLKVKARGSVLVPITPINTKTDQFDIALTGNGQAQPTYTTYENEKGEAKEAKLELNFGSGYKKSALEVAETLKLNAGEALTLEA